MMKKENLTAVSVPDSERNMFLLELFGNRHFAAGEAKLFSVARELAAEDYTGGLWLYRRTSNGALYAAPEKPDRFMVTSFGSQREFNVSADSAGIIFTLYVLGRMMETITADEELELLHDRYYALLDYAKTLPEGNAIRSAVS